MSGGLGCRWLGKNDPKETAKRQVQGTPQQRAPGACKGAWQAERESATQRCACICAHLK